MYNTDIRASYMYIRGTYEVKFSQCICLSYIINGEALITLLTIRS